MKKALIGLLGILFLFSVMAVAGATQFDDLTLTGAVIAGAWEGTVIGVTYGGTGAATAEAARTALGLAIGTNVQAYDADLGALAGLTSAANAIPYFTGLGTASVISSSANVISFLGATDTAGMVTALALTIGTNVQAWDADLDALAGVTGAANAIPYFTAEHTAGVISSTANMISLLGSATYAAAAQNLSLEIGVDTQAWDVDLDALAGLASAANAIPYFTGAGTAGVISSSANMISLLGSATYLAATQALSVEIGVDVEAWDADLDIFATLTPTADAQTLLESTNFLSMTQDLSLEIGVDTEAWDADLDTYAGITPSATAQLALEYGNNSAVLNKRARVTVAQLNTGYEVLPAIAGKSYRMIQCQAIAYGGAVGTTTTVDLLGTQAAGSVKLVAYAQASLTQSTVLVSGGTGAAVTADGASYVACDVATAITVGVTGGDADTATGVDFILTYVIE